MSFSNHKLNQIFLTKIMVNKNQLPKKNKILNKMKFYNPK